MAAIRVFSQNRPKTGAFRRNPELGTQFFTAVLCVVEYPKPKNGPSFDIYFEYSERLEAI